MKNRVKFYHKILVMISGGAAGSLFTLAIIPFISRLFTPNDFGNAAIFVTLAMIIGTVAPLRYERASMLTDDTKEAAALIALSIACTLLVTIVTGIGFLACIPFDIAPYQQKLGLWVLLIPLAIFVIGINTTFEMYLLREEKFKAVAAAEALDPVVNGSSRLALGAIFGSSFWPLISSIFTGLLIRLAILTRTSLPAIQLNKDNFKPINLFALAKTYKDFPLINAPAGLINRLATDLPVLLIGLMFSPAVVGLYAMAMRLLQAPIMVCSNAVRKVFHQQAAASHRKHESLIRPFFKIILLTTVTGALPFGILYLWGQELITALLGERWATAGYYCEILTPWAYSLWITNPSSVVIEVLRKQKIWLRIQLIHVISRSGVFLFAYQTGMSAAATLKLFVFACLLGSLLALTVSIYFVITESKGIQPNSTL